MNQDCSSFVSILGSPCFWKLPCTYYATELLFLTFDKQVSVASECWGRRRLFIITKGSKGTALNLLTLCQPQELGDFHVHAGRDGEIAKQYVRSL